MRRRTAEALAALAALTVALAGCGGQTRDVGGGAPTSATASGNGSGRSYVALGDSYTAGPNIGGTAAATGPEGCRRSEQNYPHLVAAELGLQLDDVSCGGAQTANMTEQQQTTGATVPPQFDALGKDTDVVSVSIGGNDFSSFARIVLGCVQLAKQDPTGSPCTDRLATKNDWLATYTQTLEGRILKVLRGIGDRAPDARVLVVGYPQIIPASGHCSGLPLATGDYALARKINRAYDVALSGAADTVGATYVDTWSASAGHDICATDPWIAGQVPTGEAASYHPYAVEQRAVAGLIEKVLG